jgi:hypothetical protein
VKRLPRIIVNSLTLLSLLMCAAAFLQWFNQGLLSRLEDVHWVSPAGVSGTDRRGIVGLRNQVAIYHMITAESDSPIAQSQPHGVVWDRSAVSDTRATLGQTNSLGFGYEMGRGPLQTGIIYNCRFVVPLWFVFGMGSVLSIGRIVRKRLRQRQIRVGFCKVCGYDLRATPDRCPECGTIPTKTART